MHLDLLFEMREMGEELTQIALFNNHIFSMIVAELLQGGSNFLLRT